MLCRVLIAAVAFTYLVCVILLSGMQKEDLDVSMLTKLQRYNVNIDDMNNEELLEACIQSQNKDKIKKIDDNRTAAQPFTSKYKNDYKTNAALEIIKSTPKENYFYNMSTDSKVNNAFQDRNSNTAKAEADKNKSNFHDIPQYPVGQTPLENALKYLQDIQENKAVKHIKLPLSIKEKESKRSITDNLDSSDSDTLNRLIANFLSKRKYLSTKPTTTQKTINIEELYEKYFSLRIKDMENNSNINSDFQKSFRNLPNQQYYQNTKIDKEVFENDGDKKEVELNSPNRINFTDALTSLDTYKSSNTASDGKRDDTRRTNIEPTNKLSHDMIKEIADSVKELILRDLRKELHGTTTLTTTPTTTTKLTSTVQSTSKAETTTKLIFKNENTNTQNSVMSKFLELFEEIKSLKQKTIVIPNEKVINIKDMRPNTDIKEVEVYPQIEIPARISSNNIQSKLPVNNNHRIKQYSTVNLENNFNFAPQVHKYRSDRTFIKQESKEPNISLLPITVQTNNIEIPPLSIPLDKSQNLIRQNIIITTTIPYRIVPITKRPLKKINQNKSNQHSETSKTFKAHSLKQMHPRISREPYKPAAHQFHYNNKDDVIRFTLNNNEHSKYNADYYEKINIGKYKPRQEIKHQVIPRFHEKLEKVENYPDYPEQYKYTDENDCCNEKYRYSQAMVDCCNRKIASRHQTSLNNIKNKSYDDTDVHFKNFLQSQQKVTDMLEKILGDKRNVQSVETA